MNLTSPQRRLIAESDFENRKKSRDYQPGDLESTVRYYRDLLRRGEIDPDKLWYVRITTKDDSTRQTMQEVLGQTYPTVDIIVRIFQSIDNSGLSGTKDLFKNFRNVARHWWRHQGYDDVWPNPHISDEDDFMSLSRYMRQIHGGEGAFIRAASEALRRWSHQHQSEISVWLDS